MANRDGLQCEVTSLHYDFDETTGCLSMPIGSCCDMTACIELFQMIDPRVNLIVTTVGDRRDTCYRKPLGGKWEAFGP